MNKKQKKVIIISGISLLAIILISLSAWFLTEQTGYGGTILSLQKSDFVSNDPAIGGQAWLLTMVQNGASQSAYGYFTPDQVKEINPGGEIPQFPLEVTLSSTPQKCTYNIYSQGKTIDSYEVILKGTKYVFKNSCVTDCGIMDSSFKPRISLINPGDCYCYKKTPIATYGTVSFDKLQFSSDVIAKINGVEYKGTISNTDQVSVWLGTKNEVQATWLGNLVDGSDCPRASDNDVAAAYKSTTGWHLTSSSSFTQYQSAQAEFDSCIARYVDYGTETPQTCINSFNSKANLALIQKSFTAVGGETAVQTSISNSAGKSEITLGKAIQYPMFTMRIKADLMGVVVPVGMPKIVSGNSQCFQTGKDGFLVVDVKNIGTTTGSFVASAKCELPFSQTGTSITTQVSPGLTQTINIPITGESNIDKKSNCIVSVNDVENPNNKDSKSIEACVTPIVICKPDETRCNGIIKETCNNAGSGWNVKQGDTSCKSVLDCDKTPEDPRCGTTTCKFSLLHPIDYIKCVLTPLVWIVAIIGGLITLLLSMFLINKYFPGQTIMAVIFGIIFGALIGVVLYLYLLVGLIILVIYMIISAIIGMIPEYIKIKRRNTK